MFLLLLGIEKHLLCYLNTMYEYVMLHVFYNKECSLYDLSET